MAKVANDGMMEEVQPLVTGAARREFDCLPFVRGLNDLKI